MYKGECIPSFALIYIFITCIILHLHVYYTGIRQVSVRVRRLHRPPPLQPPQAAAHHLPGHGQRIYIHTVLYYSIHIYTVLYSSIHVYVLYTRICTSVYMHTYHRSFDSYPVLYVYIHL